MKIIDILIQTANVIGLSREARILSAATEETEETVLETEEILSLFNLMKYSLQELCTNYVPIIEKAEVEITNNAYPVKNLTNYICVQGITKENKPVSYKIINRNIILEENGTYTIEYATYPTINSMFEELDFLTNLSPDVIVLGLSAYYTLAHGRFDEFKIFHEEYTEKAESLRELKMFNLPQRRWE